MLALIAEAHRDIVLLVFNKNMTWELGDTAFAMAAPPSAPGLFRHPAEIVHVRNPISVLRAKGLFVAINFNASRLR